MFLCNVLAVHSYVISAKHVKDSACAQLQTEPYNHQSGYQSIYGICGSAHCPQPVQMQSAYPT